MEKEQTDIRAEKDVLHRTTNEGITNEMTKPTKIYNLAGSIVATVELEFLCFAVKVIQEFSMWYREEVSGLKEMRGGK